MKALIDGDIIVYSVGFASDQQSYWVNNESFRYKADAKEFCERNEIELSEIEKRVEPEPLEYCLHSVKQLINSVLSDVKAEKFEIFLTGDKNFREDLATIQPYKGNRDPNHKPHWYAEIKEYLIDVWEATVIDGKEADDAMGVEQFTAWGTQGAEETIICTIDKDLDMIPGKHYNWRAKREYTMHPEECLRAFYTQLLTGDAVDNIRGVPGIGKVRAADILASTNTEEEMFQAVYEAYYNKHLQEGMPDPSNDEAVLDELIENARLLWIWRKENDEWNPPITASQSPSQTEALELTFVVE